MKTKKIPFNVWLLDHSDQRIGHLFEVKVTDIYEASTNDFHPQGLYSSFIFGKPGDPRRDKTPARVNLNVRILHPKVFQVLTRMKGLYKEIAAGTGYAIFDETLKDFVRSDALDGQTGYHFLMSNFNRIDFKRNSSIRRDLTLDLIEKYKKIMFLSQWIILPAGLRDLEFDESGRPIEQDINKLYRGLISVANSIPATLKLKETDELDAVRWNIQRRVNEIYDYLEDIVGGGKSGMIQSKWASRRIVGGTRNVISAMVPVSPTLDNGRLPNITTTQVGIFQFMKGCMPLVRHRLKNEVLPHLFDDLKRMIVIDKKTLRPVAVKPSQKTRDLWSTRNGIEALVNQFGDVGRRHRPVEIEDGYPVLIYRDDKYVGFVKDIETLPDHLDKKRVKPITWAELFYLVVQPLESKTRGFVTRYPVTGMESIYPTELYVKTTTNAKSLEFLDGTFAGTGYMFPEMPDTEGKSAFIDTLIPHTSTLKPMGAD